MMGCTGDIRRDWVGWFKVSWVDLEQKQADLSQNVLKHSRNSSKVLSKPGSRSVSWSSSRRFLKQNSDLVRLPKHTSQLPKIDQIIESKLENLTMTPKRSQNMNKSRTSISPKKLLTNSSSLYEKVSPNDSKTPIKALKNLKTRTDVYGQRFKGKRGNGQTSIFYLGILAWSWVDFWYSNAEFETA